MATVVKEDTEVIEINNDNIDDDDVIHMVLYETDRVALCGVSLSDAIVTTEEDINCADCLAVERMYDTVHGPGWWN